MICFLKCLFGMNSLNASDDVNEWDQNASQAVVIGTQVRLPAIKEELAPILGSLKEIFHDRIFFPENIQFLLALDTTDVEEFFSWHKHFLIDSMQLIQKSVISVQGITNMNLFLQVLLRNQPNNVPEYKGSEEETPYISAQEAEEFGKVIALNNS